MPNFVYEQYRSPYISTIGELLLHQNDARAHAAEVSAQAQARATEQRGQIVAGVIQTAGQIPLQIQQGRQQAVADEANRLKLTEMKSAIAERDAFKQTLRDTPMLTENGLQIYDLPTLTQKSAARGIDPAVYIKPLSELNDAFRQFNASRQAVVVEGAKKVAAAGNDPEFANAFLDTIAGNHVYPPEQIQQFRDLIKVGGQPAVARLTSYLMGPQKIENATPGSMARNSTTGELVPGSQVPPNPTEASIALQASGGDSSKAMALLKPPPPPRAAPSMDEQLLTAISTGDTTKAQQIRETLKQAAMARKDPAAFALANELGNLRKEEAQARLDAMKQKAAPLDVSPDIQTTQAGRKYIDLSGYQGEERNKARTAANVAGAIPVSKEQADALQNIDNARSNQASILTQISDVLPKGPAGRAGAALAVPLEKLFQTNDQIAAFNTWRTAAIQTMRATAGSKGLRINRAEIEQAVENDIPKLTDTVSVAQQKIKNVETMLENAEQSILVRNRAVTPPTYGPPAPPTLTPGLRKLGQRP